MLYVCHISHIRFEQLMFAIYQGTLSGVRYGQLVFICKLEVSLYLHYYAHRHCAAFCGIY